MVCTQLNLSKKYDITTNCDDNDDHHHELQHCLLKETSSKHVGGWCFFLRYLCTSHQWNLTLSTCSRQWCWLTKVVLPRSSQQHYGYNTIILTSSDTMDNAQGSPPGVLVFFALCVLFQWNSFSWYGRILYLMNSMNEPNISTLIHRHRNVFN